MDNLNYTLTRLYTDREAFRLFRSLELEIVYLQDPKIFVYGRHVSLPRKIAAYGDSGTSYAFSGLGVCAEPWTETLSKIKHRIQLTTGDEYNFVLINRYENGNQYIGKHRDGESELCPKSNIASLSLGGERTFVFSRSGHEDVRLHLLNGSLLIMKPPTNRYWYHSLPKSKTSEIPRINLTFRKIKQWT